MNKNIYSSIGFRYIFEIIVIVFSVTLSFYIQDILNEREKIELKNKSLKGVINDLAKDFESFKRAQKVLTRRIKISEDFLNGQVSSKYLNAIISTYDFGGVDSNYKSLLSTGAIEYINNNSLIEELTTYYEKDYSVLEDLFGQYKHLYLDFTGYMISNYPIEKMKNITIVDNVIDLGTENYFSISGLKYNEKTLAKLNEDYEFQNHVYALKRIILNYMAFYQIAIDKNGKLSNLIEKELNL
tara:strand:+ start:373 stop:1095 length:723 start_codon:yes stop_codon:yes gene_type:complete